MILHPGFSVKSGESGVLFARCVASHGIALIPSFLPVLATSFMSLSPPQASANLYSNGAHTLTEDEIPLAIPRRASFLLALQSQNGPKYTALNPSFAAADRILFLSLLRILIPVSGFPGSGDSSI